MLALISLQKDPKCEQLSSMFPALLAPEQHVSYVIFDDF